jgi:hypothetical protein
MDKETITTFIQFVASGGLVLTGYYIRKVLVETDRGLSVSPMSREWVMRNHPSNTEQEK